MLPRLRQKLAAPALLALALIASTAAFAADVPTLRSIGAPSFTADVSVSIDSLTRPSIVVTITVPYAELSWQRAPNGYAAGTGFSVELQPLREDRLYGSSWEKRIAIARYEATHASRNNLVESRSYDVPPGRYRVRVEVRDLSSERVSQAQDQFELENLARVPVGFADLQMGVLDSTGAFLPVPTRVFGFNSDRIAIRAATFDRREGAWPRLATFHYKVVDAEAEVRAQGDTAVSLTQPTQAVLLLPALPELFIGDYTLELDRIEGKSRWHATRRFEVEESGPPLGRDFQTMLEALAYIAPSEEVEGMRRLNGDQQAEAWERFWRRRDPTPETPRNEFQIEFFRRLHYADQHFQGFTNGWRSDMGRIYIKYGPPDQVEQRTATVASPQMEIWFYNQPSRRFVFADRDGFGRFILVSPALE